MTTDVLVPDKLGFLSEPSRYKVAYGGRGAAKSWGFARELLIQGAEQPLRILCAREIQDSIRDSVHRLLCDQVEALGLGDFYRITQNEIKGANGTEIVFAGLRQQDVHKIKSFEGVDRCWVEEAQAVSERSWAILTPTIRKPGSEIWVSFNPELDTDPTYLRFVTQPPVDSIVVSVNWHDNPWFPLELEKERKDLELRDPAAYENVWEGKCRSAVEGAIYTREIEAMHRDKRLRAVPYDPMLKVHTVWDLGFVRMPITLVQRQGSELRIIEYIENEETDYALCVQELRKRAYNWGDDWLPHDAAAHSPHTGKTPEMIVRDLGRSVRIVPKHDVEHGIKQARLIFPRCYFDQDKAMGLVNRLKRYRRSIPVTTNEPGSPLHDENSDGADTFRYLATIADKLTNDDMTKMAPLRYSNAGII